MTHSGVYPLLFCFAWGSSQAVGAAAAQAVGRGDARELARVTRLGLGLSVVLAFALPWGAYAACGRPTLAWLVEGGPESEEMLATSLHFMSLLAIFFVFDFAINFLSALLRAAGEQAYLLKVAAATATGFGLLVVTLPRLDVTWLLGAFITAQAARSALLLVRIVRRWPGTAGMSGRLRPGTVRPTAAFAVLCVTGAAPAGNRPPTGRPRGARAAYLAATDGEVVLSRLNGRASKATSEGRELIAGAPFHD
jgi:O-antigen/teichoic acid export membrane protein